MKTDGKIYFHDTEGHEGACGICQYVNMLEMTRKEKSQMQNTVYTTSNTLRVILQFFAWKLQHNHNDTAYRHWSFSSLHIEVWSSSRVIYISCLWFISWCFQ